MLSRDELLSSEVAYNLFCDNKYQLLYDLRKEKYFYTTSLEEIGKQALIQILDVDINESFDVVYTSFQEIFNDSETFNTINDKKSLYVHMAKEYLSLDTNPKEELFKLYEIVNTDLKEIEENLLFLNNELKEIKDIKNLNVENRYRRKHIQFYISKNEQAKNEIIGFLCKDIYYDAYNNSNSNRIPLPMFLSVAITCGLKLLYPYNDVTKSLEAYNKPYDINDFTDLDNKVSYLIPQKYNEIRESYRRGNNSKILILLRDHIAEDSILVKLLDMCLSNHILNNRYEIIKIVLKHYEKKDYISVNNMLPLQIEGIFHDYCVLLGIKEATIDISSINDKIEHINKKENNGFSNYEYFSFRFPIIRNKVAHGRYLDTNDELQAVFLILDLYSVFKTITSTSITVNKKISIVKDITACKVEGSLEYMGKMYELIDYFDIEIPQFYNLDSEMEVINTYYKSSNFLRYFKNEINRFSLDIQEVKVKFLKNYLLKNNICNKTDTFIISLENIFRKINKKKKKKNK